MVTLKLILNFMKLEDRNDRAKALEALLKGEAVGYGLELKTERLQIMNDKPTRMVNCKFYGYNNAPENI